MRFVITAMSRFAYSPSSSSWKRLRSSMLASSPRKAPSASSPGSPTAFPYLLRALTTPRESSLHLPAPPDPTEASSSFNASRRQWATTSRRRHADQSDTNRACASDSRSAARRPCSPNSTQRSSSSSESSPCIAITKFLGLIVPCLFPDDQQATAAVVVDLSLA